MGLFGKSGKQEKIYLTVMESEETETREGWVRILFCDAGSKLTTAEIESSFYENLAARIDELGQAEKSCAAILVSGGGQPEATYILEISAQQARTLDKILHAVYDCEEVPRVFNKPLKEIIKLARERIKTFTTLCKERDTEEPYPEVPGLIHCPRPD